MERKRYEVAKTAFYQRVLGGEEAVVCIEAHGFGQAACQGYKRAAQVPSELCRDWLLKEQPCVAAVAGPRPLHGNVEVELASCVTICGNVLLPTGAVEVSDQNGGLAVFVGHIESHDVTEPVISASEMGDKHLVGEELEVAVGATGAYTGTFALCLVSLGANARLPLV